MPSRRQLLSTFCRSAAFGLPLVHGLSACQRPIVCPDRPDAGAPPLKVRAEKRGLILGTAADRIYLEDDPRYAERVAAECAMVTPENSMKWERLRPTPDRFTFDQADWLMDFASEHGLSVHGHALVWHSQMPGWFPAVANEKNAEALLSEHVETVAGRYAGRIRAWDVVNEAIEPEEGRADGLRKTPWLEFLGPEHIDLAFHLAAESDSEAMLVYNDYDVEYEDPYYVARRHHMLALLEGLVARGVPVHALGLQSHLRGHKTPSFESFSRFLDEVEALGLDILITELDVRDQRLPADEKERDCLVADSYKAYLEVVLERPNLRSLTVWGLADPYSWLAEIAPREDGLAVRPLPLDRDMVRKPAWSAIAEALAG